MLFTHNIGINLELIISGQDYNSQEVNNYYLISSEEGFFKQHSKLYLNSFVKKLTTSIDVRIKASTVKSRTILEADITSDVLQKESLQRSGIHIFRHIQSTPSGTLTLSFLKPYDF